MNEVQVVLTCSKENFFMLYRHLTWTVNFTESVQQGVIVYEVDDENPLKQIGRPGKLTIHEKNEIASKYFTDHVTYSKLADEYGVSISSIKRVCDSMKIAYKKDE